MWTLPESSRRRKAEEAARASAQLTRTSICGGDPGHGTWELIFLSLHNLVPLTLGAACQPAAVTKPSARSLAPWLRFVSNRAAALLHTTRKLLIFAGGPYDVEGLETFSVLNSLIS
ncbi:unnamed protein product [Rangifer tarandus platyrhynchus]|uniref:Uncharacterized protein n=1 Tax=Rangifer tarandus platyrhynchus TaxID=3082113 RepID=A0ABN8XU14_RANTA|nr:unnamed protein product [Rangifer tarandus platyrhynchus]